MNVNNAIDEEILDFQGGIPIEITYDKADVPKKKRGRPKKNISEENKASNVESMVIEERKEEPPKKKRGRPPKKLAQSGSRTEERKSEENQSNSGISAWQDTIISEANLCSKPLLVISYQKIDIDC